MKSSWKQTSARIGSLFLLACLSFSPQSWAQPSPSPRPPELSLTATPSPSTRAVPLPEMVTESEDALTQLKAMSDALASEPTLTRVQDEFQALSLKVTNLSQETKKLGQSSPSLEKLKGLDAEWQGVADELTAWKLSLNQRAAELDQQLTQLEVGQVRWTLTLSEARQALAPPEVLGRIQSILDSESQLIAVFKERRALALRLQNRVAEQDSQVTQARVLVKQVQEATLGRLFVQDSPPLWSSAVRAEKTTGIWQECWSSLASQASALKVYVQEQQDRFLIHALVIILLTLGLHRARARIRPWVAAEPALAVSARVFGIPWATALVLSLSLSHWLYPQSPRMLGALLGAAALLPTVLILRRLLETHLWSILYALVCFYFVDQLRILAASLPLLSRLLLQSEMLAGIVLLIWLLRNPAFQGKRLLAQAAAALLAGAFGANLFGYVSVANLVGDAVLSSAYLAVILYAALRIADGLLMFAFRIPPLSRLRAVTGHRALLRLRGRRFFGWVAVLSWALLSLEMLSLRRPMLDWLVRSLTTPMSLGAIHIALGDVLAFAVSVWLSFSLSRLLRFVLEEDVYPQAHLARGLPYAISTMTHYTVVILGFTAGIAALGVDLTRLTVLAGALGVGLGFGLQNIVQNFVSGLILLFERPVKVGDIVQLGEITGIVKRIGIRASVIQTVDKADIVVPNAKLISDSFTNWTFSSQERGFEVIVGVEYGTDAERVLGLLREIGQAHPAAMQSPSPLATLAEFGSDSVNFSLRVWTDRPDAWMSLGSDLLVSIYARFENEGICIPNVQRDLHIRSIDAEAARALRGS